jgi:hypothetical protein
MAGYKAVAQGNAHKPLWRGLPTCPHATCGCCKNVRGVVISCLACLLPCLTDSAAAMASPDRPNGMMKIAGRRIAEDEVECGAALPRSPLGQSCNPSSLDLLERAAELGEVEFRAELSGWIDRKGGDVNMVRPRAAAEGMRC